MPVIPSRRTASWISPTLPTVCDGNTSLAAVFLTARSGSPDHLLTPLFSVWPQPLSGGPRTELLWSVPSSSAVRGRVVGELGTVLHRVGRITLSFINPSRRPPTNSNSGDSPPWGPKLGCFLVVLVQGARSYLSAKSAKSPTSFQFTKCL